MSLARFEGLKSDNVDIKVENYMRLVSCLVGNESVRAVRTAGTGVRTIDE